MKIHHRVFLALQLQANINHRVVFTYSKFKLWRFEAIALLLTVSFKHLTTDDSLTSELLPWPVFLLHFFFQQSIPLNCSFQGYALNGVIASWAVGYGEFY